MPLIEILVSAEPSWVDLGLWLLLCLGAAGSGSNWKKLFGMGKKEGKGGGTSAKTDPGIGSDWERAAKIFEDDGRYREAAQLCSGHGHNYEAARLLVQAGALTEAARSKTSSKRFACTPRPVGSTRRPNWPARWASAIRRSNYLQKVTDSSPDYQAALVDLADSFIEQDMPGVAVEKLKRALGDKERVE